MMRGFLGEVLDGFEQLLGELALYGDALHEAVAIADDGKGDFSGAAEVVQPAGDLDSLSGVSTGLSDGDAGHGQVNLLILSP